MKEEEEKASYTEGASLDKLGPHGQPYHMFLTFYVPSSFEPVLLLMAL